MRWGTNDVNQYNINPKHKPVTKLLYFDSNFNGTTNNKLALGLFNILVRNKRYTIACSNDYKDNMASPDHNESQW